MKKILFFVSFLVIVTNMSSANEQVIISGHFAKTPIDWQEEEKIVGAGIEILGNDFSRTGNRGRIQICRPVETSVS